MIAQRQIPGNRSFKISVVPARDMQRRNSNIPSRADIQFTPEIPTRIGLAMRDPVAHITRQLRIGNRRMLAYGTNSPALRTLAHAASSLSFASRKSQAAAHPRATSGCPTQESKPAATLPDDKTSRDRDPPPSYAAQCTPALQDFPPLRATASIPDKRIHTCRCAHCMQDARAATQSSPHHRGPHCERHKTHPPITTPAHILNDNVITTAAQTTPDAHRPRSKQYRAHKAGASAA
jgi:hypothetical protein